MNYRIEPDGRGTYAVYMTGENQPIQTRLTREQAENWVKSPFRWRHKNPSQSADCEGFQPE